jgi:outer membrane protein, adhesin transport system
VNAKLQPKIIVAMLSIVLLTMDSAAHAQNNTNALSSDELRVLRDFTALSDKDYIKVSDANLKKMVRIAIENSPLVREGKLNILAANQDINAAKGARYPQITGTGQSRVSGGDIPLEGRATGKLSYSVAAQMPIYDWGKIDALIAGRNSARDATAARFRLQGQNLAIEATKVCLEYNKQRALLGVSEEYIANVDKILVMLNKISKADAGRAGEMVQTRSRVLQAKSSQDAIRSKLQEAKIKLERILGKENIASCNGIGASFIVNPDIESIRKNIKKHPQVEALEADRRSQKSNLDQISASRKPLVQLTSSYGSLYPGVAAGEGYNVSLMVTAPIFDGDILKSNERAAAERVSAGDERIEEATRQVDSLYREKYELASSGIKRAQDYTALLEVSDRVRKDFFLQWSSLGKRSLFELLSIELEQYTLQTNYVTTLFDAMSGYAEIMGNAGMIYGSTDTK